MNKIRQIISELQSYFKHNDASKSPRCCQTVKDTDFKSNSQPQFPSRFMKFRCCQMSARIGIKTPQEYSRHPTVLKNVVYDRHTTEKPHFIHTEGWFCRVDYCASFIVL